MAEVIKKPRPEYRNIGLAQLIKYRLPLAGIISILHRISGAILFFLLPFALYLFEQSLTSEITFDTLKGIASNLIVKLFILALSWAFLFHFCAGIRHLIMDTHRALSKESGRSTSLVVFAVSTLLTLAVALKLFGAF
jgi:succinate dehydrogenase / fumarate reductase cytochrome b subunit